MARVVIVNDEPDVLATYAHVLTRAGHDVVECRDGESALAQVRKDPPDLLLTDVAMPPGMSGLDLAAELGADPAVADIPVILVAAGWVEMDTTEPLRAARLLRKPVAPQDLVRNVETVLAGRLRHHVRLPAE